jgi:hypothetical protein
MKKLGAFIIRFLVLLLKTSYLEANREARE